MKKMLKFFVILLTAVMAVRADDVPGINAHQQSDANTANTDSKEHAATHSVRKDATFCIGDKLNAEYSKQMQELKKQCAYKFTANNSDFDNFNPFDCKTMTSIKEAIICEEECFARAVNQIDESGQFNREAIKQHYVKLAVGDVKWKKTALDAYIDNCLAQVAANKKPQPQSDLQCSSAALELHYCIWVKFRNGCPNELRVNSPTCNKMREHLSQASHQLFHRQLFLKFLQKSVQTILN